MQNTFDKTENTNHDIASLLYFNGYILQPTYSLATTERYDTTTATESGRAFESTPDTLYGAPPIQTTEPPQLYGAPPVEETSNQGYGFIPPGTIDTSYAAALPPPRPTTVERV